MTDETNLPPDVAEAMNTISNLRPHGVPTVEGLAAYRATQTIRDYLLLITAENVRLHESALSGYEDGWHALRNERDALRMQIEALRGYAKHHDSCGDHDAHNNANVESCGCGLDSVLDAIDSERVAE